MVKSDLNTVKEFSNDVVSETRPIDAPTVVEDNKKNDCGE